MSNYNTLEENAVDAYLNSIDDKPENTKAAEVERAANLYEGGHDGFSNVSAHPSKGNAVSPQQSKASLWTPAHIAFLDQHIFLGKDARESDAFEFINEQLKDISDDFQNFKVYPKEYKTVGYHLDETREGCYRIQLFKYNNALGVNCTRLEGDSLAVSALWGQLKERLHNSNYYVDKVLADGEDDEDIFGDEEDEFDLDSFKYLDLSRDEAFVSKLVKDVRDLNIGTHALLLLKFNLQEESNLELVAGNKDVSQELFDNTVERLTEEHSSIPDVICASHILTQLLAQAALAITVDQISQMIEAADRWSTEDDASKTIVPTASEEAATLLLESISEATKQVSEDISELELQAKAQSICDKTSFDKVRDAAEAIVGSN